MSDAEPQESQDLHTELGSPAPPRGGRQKSSRGQDTQNRHNSQNNPNHHWRELQELRLRLAEHEETVERLKSAFGMISCALSPCLDSPPLQQSGCVYRRAGDCHRSGSNDEQSNRPGRLDRRARSNSNTSHYKTNNRGGASGGYQNYRGANSSFQGPNPGFRGA